MAAGAIIAAAAAEKKRTEQKQALAIAMGHWRALAAERRLAFVEREENTWVLPRIEGTASGTSIGLEIVLDKHGWAHTRAIADARSPANVVIAAYPSPSGIFDVVRNALTGAKDIRIGDAVFDEAFLVHSDPPEAATSLFAEGMRAALTQWLPHRLEALHYERGRISLQWNNVEVDNAMLDAAIELLTLIATWHFDEGGTSYRT